MWVAAASLLSHSMHVFRYLVLPHYKWTFSSYFASLIEEGKRPDEREVLLLLIQLCNALVHLQRHHVVHCDFKVIDACMAVCLARYHSHTHSFVRWTTCSSPSMAGPSLVTLAR